MKIQGKILELMTGDITELDVDVVVNAANSGLILGGGVAGAIRSRGGPVIQRECDRIGGTPVGTAVITTGGNLKARYVIHAVGPRMGEGDEDRKLSSAVKSSLELARERRAGSIAFPAISAGIFGFPRERCARIMISTIIEHLESSRGSFPERVLICLYDRETHDIFAEELERQRERWEWD